MSECSVLSITIKASWEQALDGWTHERDPFSLDMIDENAKERSSPPGA